LDRRELIERISEGESFRYHAFLKGPFSNWRRARFVEDGIVYEHSEQYYMAHKARFSADGESYEAIMRTPDPKIVKRLGRNERIRGFEKEAWDRVKREVMFRANLHKYRQNPHLAGILQKTGNRVLVECNPKDFEWSCGLGIDDEKVTDPFRWPGKNLLGFVLMEVRCVLRKEGRDDHRYFE